jgi:hypothetical protein
MGLFKKKTHPDPVKVCKILNELKKKKKTMKNNLSSQVKKGREGNFID